MILCNLVRNFCIWLVFRYDVWLYDIIILLSGDIETNLEIKILIFTIGI